MKLFGSAQNTAFILLCVVCSGGFAQEEDLLKIYPQQHGAPLIKKQGETFVLTCEYLPGSPENLRWERQGGAEISSDKKASVYSKTQGRNVFLYVKDARTSDSGTFACKEGEQNSKEIKLIAIEPAQWVDTQERVGELSGSRLHINCEAIGDPAPKIRITDGNGSPFERSNFEVSESRGSVVITALQETDQDTVVVCTANQLFQENDYTYPIVQEKRVVIDVYFPPRFGTPKMERYGIVGRNASLVCQVQETNPDLTDFEFHFEETIEIPRSSDRYRWDQDLAKKRATLNILKVTREDFGNYHCVARNSKASSVPLIICLSETSPPDQVEATFVKAGANSVSWQFRDSKQEGSIPVTEYRVEYLREELVKDKQPEEIEQTWKQKALKVHHKKRPGPDFAYEIDYLRPKTKYRFRIRAVSEAGWGDFIELGAETVSETESAASVSSAQQRTIYSLPRLFTVTFASFVFCFLLVRR